MKVIFSFVLAKLAWFILPAQTVVSGTVNLPNGDPAVRASIAEAKTRTGISTDNSVTLV